MPKKITFWFIVFVFAVFILFRFTSGSVWDGSGKISLVIISNPLLLVTFDKPEETASVISIPSNTFINVPYGYGSYKISSIYPLGELEPKRGGGRLLASTIESVFGVPVDGFIGGKKGVFENIIINNKEDYLSVKMSLFSLKNLFNPFAVAGFVKSNINTNLSSYDILRLWLEFRNIRFDKVSVYNLSHLDILSDEKLPDLSQVKIIDPDKLDKVLEGVFEDSKVREENLSIVVTNTSGVLGIAASCGRIIANMGAKLVATQTGDTANERCIIKGDAHSLKSYTATRLRRIWGCKEGKGSAGQGDLTVTIGRDFNK